MRVTSQYCFRYSRVKLPRTKSLFATRHVPLPGNRERRGNVCAGKCAVSHLVDWRWRRTRKTARSVY